MTTERNADLRASLDARRLDLVRDIHGRIREGRAEQPSSVGDIGDLSDRDIRADLDRALLQMRAEALIGIDNAIRRLDDGQYGRCVECEGEIAARRLRALPFAVRCRACEEQREPVPGRARPSQLTADF